MGQEALGSECGRAEKLAQDADTLDRSEELLDAAARHALATADRLHSDSKALPNGVGPSRPRALGVSLDLADEARRNPRRDPLEGVLGARCFGLARG